MSPSSFASGRVDVAAGEQEISGHRVRDLAPQTHDRAAQRVEAPRTSDTPKRALSPAMRMSVPCRISVPPATAGPSTAAINGLSSRKPLSSGLMTPSEMPLTVSSGLCGERVAWMKVGHRLEVGAGAEATARAGQDRDADVGVALTSSHAADSPSIIDGDERVAALWSVHRDDEDVAVAFDEQMLVRWSCRRRARLTRRAVEHILVLSRQGPGRRACVAALAENMFYFRPWRSTWPIWSSTRSTRYPTAPR